MKRLILPILASAFLLGCETVPNQPVERTREELLFESGREAMDENDLYTAQRQFKEVLELNPRNTQARYYLREVQRVLEE